MERVLSMRSLLRLLGAAAMVLCGPGSPLSAQLVISEVFYDPVGVNTGRQVVEITNTGATEVQMGPSGYWLYFQPARWQFPPGVVIPSQGIVLVNINRPGTASANEFFTGISGMRALKSKDALALFRSNAFADPAEIVDFVQWGSVGNGGEDVAIAAGIWPTSSFVAVTSLREGSSLAYDGAGDQPSDWCVDGSPTLGAPNDGCTPSFARSSVILHEVGYVRDGAGHYHPAVELKCVGDVLEDMGGRILSLANQHFFQFPLGTPDTLIGPGDILVVHLGVNGQNAPLEFYTGAGTFRDLHTADSVSLHAVQPATDPTTMIDFVQWGAAGAPLESAAVSAGLWDAGTFVDATDRKPRGSVASFDDGKGASRWTIDNTGTIGDENSAPPFVPVVINEVLVDPAGNSTGDCAVELKCELEDEAVNLGGMSLCTESTAAPGTLACFSFPPGTEIEPGGLLVVQLNRSGLPPAGVVNTGPFEELSPSGGEILLSLTGNAADPNNAIDYVRWGSGPPAGEETAVLAGIWSTGDSVAVGRVRDSSSLAYLGAGDDSSDFRVDWTPSLGADNAEEPRDEPFRRGDCNDDSKVDISDAIKIFGYLFLGDRAPFCNDACDSNDDSWQDISDPVFILNYLFLGSAPPPSPGPTICGPDERADALSCSAYLSCGG
jgi:hypothetical protein